MSIGRSIVSAGDTAALVRATVESVLEDWGLDPTGNGTTLTIKGPAIKPLMALHLTYCSANQMTGPKLKAIPGEGEALPPEYARSRFPSHRAAC